MAAPDLLRLGILLTDPVAQRRVASIDLVQFHLGHRQTLSGRLFLTGLQPAVILLLQLLALVGQLGLEALQRGQLLREPRVTLTRACCVIRSRSIDTMLFDSSDTIGSEFTYSRRRLTFCSGESSTLSVFLSRSTFASAAIFWDSRLISSPISLPCTFSFISSTGVSDVVPYGSAKSRISCAAILDYFLQFVEFAGQEGKILIFLGVFRVPELRHVGVEEAIDDRLGFLGVGASHHHGNELRARDGGRRNSLAGDGVSENFLRIGLAFRRRDHRDELLDPVLRRPAQEGQVPRRQRIGDQPQQGGVAHEQERLGVDEIAVTADIRGGIGLARQDPRNHRPDLHRPLHDILRFDHQPDHRQRRRTQDDRRDQHDVPPPAHARQQIDGRRLLRRWWDFARRLVRDGFLLDDLVQVLFQIIHTPVLPLLRSGRCGVCCREMMAGSTSIGGVVSRARSHSSPTTMASARGIMA